MSKLSNFNFSKITYSKPKKVKGMYISELVYEGQEVNIQLKRKITSSGVYREGNKYYMDLTFDNENDKDVKFMKLYKQLEMISIKEIYNKYNEWMNVDDKLEWEDVYTSFKSHLSEIDDICCVKLNLITHKNIMDTEFYNEELEKISFKDIEEGDELSLVVNLKGIRFGKEKFENQWEIVQVKVYKDDSVEEVLNNNFEEKCRIEVDSDIDETEENSIDIEEIEKLDNFINNKYKQYIHEESLKIIE